eukprot:1122466-Rhodomonas_salina.1
MEVLLALGDSAALVQPPVSCQLAGALILPIDGLPSESDSSRPNSVEQRNSANEPALDLEAGAKEPASPNKRPTAPNVMHLVLCGNALAIGAVSATFKWAQKSLDGDEEA